VLLRYARASVTFVFALVLVASMTVASATPADAATFPDTSGSFVEEAAASLAAEGVVQGCGNGDFCPWEPLTRAQLATVLVAALDLPDVEVSSFTDLGDSVHADSIEQLAAAGITQGCAPERFCPGDTITRGQLASMLAVAFEVSTTADTFFDDAGVTHADGIHRLAADGIAAGCGNPLTAFCTGSPVQRAHAAVFLARAMDLIERVELSSLEVRRTQQAEIDAEAQRRREAEAEAEAARQAEADAKAKAEADAAATTSRVKIWDDLAQCESNGNWSINTGNGYYGGLQFSLSTWRWVGGSGYPHQATKSEQILRAERLLVLSGWRAWPACTLRLGYR
jgi:hypothetical protein